MDGLLLSGHPLPHSIADRALPAPRAATTRAMLALLQLDLKMYLYYQPTAVPLTIAVVLCIHLRHLKKPFKGIAAALAGVMLLANTAVYFAKV